MHGLKSIDADRTRVVSSPSTAAAMCLQAGVTNKREDTVNAGEKNSMSGAFNGNSSLKIYVVNVAFIKAHASCEPQEENQSIVRFISAPSRMPPGPPPLLPFSAIASILVRQS